MGASQIPITLSFNRAAQGYDLRAQMLSKSDIFTMGDEVKPVGMMMVEVVARSAGRKSLRIVGATNLHTNSIGAEEEA